MKTILYVLIAVAILVGGFYALNNFIYNEKQGEDVSELDAYFMEQMLERGISDIGQPIEGFDAQLLLMAYPGLEVSDFHGVEALEGVYTATGDSLSFGRTRSQPISSAERTISKEGYATLLENVSVRISLPVTTETDVDALIDTVDLGERVRAGFGESAGSFEVTITPTELLEDSRCPVDVTCVQHGTVRIVATLEANGNTENQELLLGIPIEVGAVEITLVQVLPVAESTVDIEAGEYMFTFEVVKQ